MYVVLFKRLHALFDERNADYMAFNEIRGELEKLLEQYAEVSTSVQQFSRKLFSYDVNQDKDDAAHVSTIRTTAVYQARRSHAALPCARTRMRGNDSKCTRARD